VQWIQQLCPRTVLHGRKGKETTSLSLSRAVVPQAQAQVRARARLLRQAQTQALLHRSPVRRRLHCVSSAYSVLLGFYSCSSESKLTTLFIDSIQYNPTLPCHPRVPNASLVHPKQSETEREEYLIYLPTSIHREREREGESIASMAFSTPPTGCASYANITNN
jgi:hypothetical protein